MIIISISHKNQDIYFKFVPSSPPINTNYHPPKASTPRRHYHSPPASPTPPYSKSPNLNLLPLPHNPLHYSSASHHQHRPLQNTSSSPPRYRCRKARRSGRATLFPRSPCLSPLLLLRSRKNCHRKCRLGCCRIPSLDMRLLRRLRRNCHLRFRSRTRSRSRCRRPSR